MKKLKTYLPFFLLSVISTITFAQNTDNCFGIIAGRLTTQDGSVLFGHNEDDGGEQMLNIYCAEGNPSKGIQKFLWAEFPGKEVADAFMNEHGVCVASDNCPSREDRMDFSEGGVLYRIRMDVAKYATSARHGVHIIGQLVEKYGYSNSGRSYLVVDTREGWVVSLVQGKHWVAQRVPDDKVMSIPNYYTIGEVNLADTLNYLGSKDIVSYAIERHWYNPTTDGTFNFRKVYASDKSLARASNSNRHERVLSSLTGSTYPYDVQDVPFVVTPNRKLGVQDLIDALSVHFEADAKGKEKPCVCTDVTRVSTIFQLRSWMPLSIGCVMWLCPGRPCSELFQPWYLGMTKSPKLWHRFASWEEAEAKHMSEAQDLRKNYPNGVYWKFMDHQDAIGHQPAKSAYRAELRQKQTQLFEQQKNFEEKAKGLSVSKLTKLLNALGLTTCFKNK